MRYQQSKLGPNDQCESCGPRLILPIRREIF
jgi:hypothetical protein